MITLGKLVLFVLENRKGNAFRSYTEEQIAEGIKQAADAGTMFYCCDTNGKVCGIVVMERLNEFTLHVHDVLATEPWVLRTLISKFRTWYPNQQLTANRKDKFVRYNTDKLCNKILKGAIE